MHLQCGPFQWPCKLVGAIQTASPDVACPGLPQKPLDATIGQLLALYCPSGRQGSSKQIADKKWTKFAGHFDGHGGAPVRYRMHCLIEEVQGFSRSHWMLPSGKYCGQYLQSDTHTPDFFEFFSLLTCRKRPRVDAKAPVFNMGITYQTKEKGLTKVTI
jgi:hypothetical protein